MATRRAWTTLFVHALRTVRQTNASRRSGAQWYRQLWSRVQRPQLLLILPAAGLLQSLSFFKSTKQLQDKELQDTQEAKLQKTIARADALYEEQKIVELVTMLQVVACDGENDEILWRLARALNEKAKRTEDKEEMKRLYFQAFDVIKTALALNDKNFACHKWYAILMDKKAEYEGIKARISGAFVVKQHFMKASELNPKDATTLYTLGVWCFLFADMPWYQRKIAATLFATPPTSTYEEALWYFHRAEEMDPNFYSKNLLMLGKTYSRMGNKKLAMLYLTRAIEFPVKTPDDRDAHKEAEELLTKLGTKVDKEKTYM